VNSAYRGDSSKAGWTTEADLLDGQRTDANEIKKKIEGKNTYILKALDNGALVGSCELVSDPEASELYFGMFTIKPTAQNRGLGKEFLKHVEKLALDWKLKTIKMTVITVRKELIEYYVRRGFHVTNKMIPFPTEAHFGLPKVKNLEMVYLVKDIHE
jgi:GNAT superfamily N-acetyltransferase